MADAAEYRGCYSIRVIGNGILRRKVFVPSRIPVFDLSQMNSDDEGWYSLWIAGCSLGIRDDFIISSILLGPESVKLLPSVIALQDVFTNTNTGVAFSPISPDKLVPLLCAFLGLPHCMATSFVPSYTVYLRTPKVKVVVLETEPVWVKTTKKDWSSDMPTTSQVRKL